MRQIDVRDQTVEREAIARLNCKIKGESAKILYELKRRGIVSSNSDAVIQGLFALHEKVIQRDLAIARLQRPAED